MRHWLVILLLMKATHAAALIPERRPAPTRLKSGFIAFPVYSVIPGVGYTAGGGMLIQNLAGTRTNVSGLLSLGDTNSAIIRVSEINLIEDTFVTSFDAYSDIIPFTGYARSSTGGPDDRFTQVNQETGGAAHLNLMLLNRRLILSAQAGASKLAYTSVQGADGTSFRSRDAARTDSVGTTFRALLDLTDDYLDPRRGLTIQIARDETDVFDRLHSRFYSLNYFATAYVPIGASSTWAFNAYRAEAFVYDANRASVEDLRSSMSLNCAEAEASAQETCQRAETLRAQNRYLENQNGTAGILGGPNQLRGYPFGRFAGSRSLFYATELRLNLLDGNRSIDWGFIRGALSLVQIAPFYEIGAVADRPQPVENAPFHSAYGVGLRLGLSGSLVRADYGWSREGGQLTVFVSYPWDLPPF